MKRVAVAALLLTGPACSRSAPERSRAGRLYATPPLEVFEDMETANALILGVVEDARGQPASGAAVYADAYFMPIGEHDYGSPSLHMAAQEEDGTWKLDAPKSPSHTPQHAITDAQGRFAFPANDELRMALRDQRVKIWAELGDLVAPKVLLRSSEYPARAATLTLGAALQPRVQLVDGQGAPVAGAFVNLSLHVEDKFGNSVDELLYSIGARSDEHGIAVLPAVPGRTDWGAWLRVNAKERPQYLDIDYSVAQLRSPDPVRVELPAGCTVRGRVELPDGAPGSGVSVSARHDPINPNPGGENATLTGKDGTFELRGVPSRAVLTFTELPADPSPEVLFFGNTAGALATREVTGSEGEVVHLGVVRLSAPMSISGVVLDKDGNPATNGAVMVEVGGALAGPHSSSPINPDGSFEIRGLEPGRHTIIATISEGELSLDDPFHGELEATLNDVPAGSTDVVIRVTGGGNLIVRFHPLGKPDERLAVWSPSVCWGHCGGGPSSKCTEVRMTLEPGKRSDLRVEGEGYKPKLLGPIEIFRDHATVIDVELEPTDTGAAGK